MHRYLHNSVPFVRLRFTASELLLLTVAGGLVCAAIVHLAVSFVSSGAFALAAAAIMALVHERAAMRWRVRQLGERLTDPATLDKLEVASAGTGASLDHALNQIIQQARAQARETEPAWPVFPQPRTLLIGESQTVAVLAIGTRQGGAEPFTSEHLVWLAQTAEAALRASNASDVALRMQPDGTLLVTCGGQQPQPVAGSMRQALAIAQALSADPQLRFGLSCGVVRLCTVTDVEPTLVGAPFEEATRLYRMAAAWHEFQLLCAEPIALLARSFPSQRTMLKLTHPFAPALPVYALDLATAPVAMTA